MVPDKFNMVDMGGIDLILMQGEEVPGLYNRLVESIAQCRYQCLYNWLFDGVVIPPTYVEMEVNENDEVVINEGVAVTSDSVIHIYSIEPEIIPLLAEENGVYTVPTGVDGFSPVTVDVPSYTPVISPISITENGVYTVPSGVDGYSPITVSVPAESSFVTPDYQGLAWSYIATNCGYYTEDVAKRYFSDYFHVKAGKTYCLFIGTVTSDRIRCQFYSGKTISDFEQYINNPIANTQVYTCTNNISGSTDLTTYDVRFIFTPLSDGEIVFVTSRTSIPAVAYCVELS